MMSLAHVKLSLVDMKMMSSAAAVNTMDRCEGDDDHGRCEYDNLSGKCEEDD